MLTNNQRTIIFVIDDEPMDNLISKLLIKKVNDEIDVDTMNSGQRAIDKLRELIINQPEQLPDFIFVDINMPNMSGWQFLNEFKQLSMDRYKKIKIYVLSSSISRKDFVRAHSNPLVIDYIYKPLNLDNLKSIFKAA